MTDNDLAGPVVRDIRVTCPAMPLQIEGNLADGRHVYFRARWETVTLGIGDTLDEAITNDRATVSFDGIGDACASHMPEALGRALCEWLARRALFEAAQPS